MAGLFQWFGLPVGLKHHVAHGLCHHYPFGILPWPFARAREEYDYLIHYVRDPWKVVESVYLHRDGIDHRDSMVSENARHIPEIACGNGLEIAVRSVVLWNRAIAEAKPDLVVRVEDAIPTCINWFEENDIKYFLKGLAVYSITPEGTRLVADHGQPPAKNANDVSAQKNR